MHVQMYFIQRSMFDEMNWVVKLIDFSATQLITRLIQRKQFAINTRLSHILSFRQNENRLEMSLPKRY